MANISEQLDKYLSSYRDRLKKVLLLKGSAILTVVILLVSIIGSMLAIRSGFADDTVIGSRLILLVAILCIGFVFFKQPLKKLTVNLAAWIESRSPAFNGRIDTYIGMGDTQHPLKELLAEDTLKITEENSPEVAVQKRELVIPAVVTSACILSLLWLLVAGPGLLNYGLRHLWAGWAFSNLLPPQTISVNPGDEAIRRGGSVKLLAQMNGFDPTSATVHVRMGDREWQEVDMIREDRGFEFTIFSVREDTDYYVSSSGVRSPDYNIEVVDLPDIENLRLTYNFPEWAKREPVTVEPGGDIQSVAGTNIELEVIMDAPLPSAVLVLNDEVNKLEVTDRTSKGDFDIEEDGQYYIAARLGNELVRLSEDYFIRILEDGKPDIKISRPGRDWTASSIEEVTVNIDASDDYALESLELRFSVNGGDWQSVPMEVTGRQLSEDHVFYLEDLQSQSKSAEGMSMLAELEAGDLVSYYARASDREQTSSTDMYFIQVQPFDRRYSQSQQGGGGAGQGGSQQEISQRQKEIIVSTWNLIREKTEATGTVKSTTEDNAMLLSELQSTLSDQALTLAERARARQLNADNQIAKFVENMELAAAAMQPASEFLQEIELEQAIQPEQEALQHLLRAEAVFTDMQVSFQQGQGGGGSDRAGQDLAEMFELEMDLKKNQYETGSPASPKAQSQQADDAMDQLEELARRQEQLANNLRQQNNLTEAQRWQQEMLRREAERLREQLERMEQANNQQQGQQSSSNNSGSQQGSTQGSEQGSQQGSEQGTGQGQAGTSSETSRRLQSAIRAMDEVAEAMNNPDDRESMERAAAEAQRQLQGARDEVARNQQRSMEQTFESMASQASELYEEQRQIEQALQQAVRRALAERDRTGQVTSGLSKEEEASLAQDKKDMTEKLQQLESDIHNSVEQYQNELPEAVSELEEARDVISRSQLQERLYVASEYIAYGAAPYIAGSESAVTQALDEISDRLQRARGAVEGVELAETDELDRTLAQTRGLRRELEQLAMQGDPSQMGEQAGQSAQQQGDPQSGGNQQGATAGGAANGGVWGGYNNRGPLIDSGAWDQFGREISDTVRPIRDAIPELRDQDLSLQEINEIRQLTQQLQQAFAFSDSGKNEDIIEQEYLSALSLLEQLELRLDAGARNKDPANVRSNAAEPVSTEYKDAVAEYYRRLSREE
jgi:hypothetical protein